MGQQYYVYNIEIFLFYQKEITIYINLNSLLFEITARYFIDWRDTLKSLILPAPCISESCIKIKI